MLKSEVHIPSGLCPVLGEAQSDEQINRVMQKATADIIFMARLPDLDFEFFSSLSLIIISSDSGGEIFWR